VALDDEQVPAKPASLDASITIERALAELAPNLRAVLVLKEIEGFSHAEIAEMLNISVSASEVRLHRALHALRAMLIKENER
jgi:RNA polymerase sigma-70 factor (ECF subfamily)